MSFFGRIADKWSQIVATHPLPIFLVTVVFNIVLTTLFVQHLLSTSFDEPLRGFEARGSSLSDRINTWKLISGKSHSRHEDDLLSLYPRREELRSFDHKDPFNRLHDTTDFEEEEEKRRLAATITDKKFSRENVVSKMGHGSFCGHLNENYVQIVLKSDDNLFTLENLIKICHLDQEIRNHPMFPNFCGASDDDPTHCCLSWSLPNLVAEINNRTLNNCSDLRYRDITAAKEWLHKCLHDYNLKFLQPNCAQDRSCPLTPPICYDRNIIYNMIHYMLDTRFLENVMTAKLKSGNLFLPVAKSSSLLPFFDGIQDIISKYQTSPSLNISSMDMGLKEALFDTLLIQDSKLVVLAFCSIAFVLWIYSGSFLVVIMTCLNLLSSAGSAYILYHFAFRISFFPFMNLMTVIIMVAVGTDNTLIFCKVWSIEMETKRPVEDILRTTLEKTLVSTFFTSLTTSLALFASFSSNITSIRCFSLYSATAVMALYILTTISLPPVLVLSSDKTKYQKMLNHKLWFNWDWIKSDQMNGFFMKTMSLLAQIKVPVALFLLIVTFGSLSTFFRYLRLPSSDYLQTFSSNHPFEIYDTSDRELFKFSRRVPDNSSNSGSFPITVVFGIKPVDSGSHLDPDDRGMIEADEEFDVSLEDTQEWLLDFCKKFKKADFYQPIHGPLLSNCFIETFKTWIEERDCFDAISNHTNYPCCKSSSFPYTVQTFNTCIIRAIELLHRTPTYIISKDSPGIRFSRSTPRVATVIVQYYSNFVRTNSYSEMKRTLNTVQKWLSDVLKSAPPGFESTWFISSHLELFALQESLLSGTFMSVGIAILLAFFAVSLVTWSIWLTLATIMTVCGVISTTLAIMIYFFGWEINIIESVVILMAIGMSVDLPLHFAICFKQNTQENLSNRTSSSLKHVGAPLMTAALTTSLAGICMLRSNILAYLKIAHFLIMISLMNIIFTFVFLTVSISRIQS